MRAAVGGFLLAVVTAAVIGTAGLVALSFADSWINGDPLPTFTDFDVRLWILAFAYLIVFSALSLGTFGILLTAVLSRLGIERAWTYPTLGFAVGFAVAFVFWTPIGEPYRAGILVFQLVAGAVPGGVAGVIWWRLYRSRARLADVGGAT